MSNKTLSWVLGFIFVLAILITWLRVFVINDYPVISEPEFESVPPEAVPYESPLEAEEPARE